MEIKTPLQLHHHRLYALLVVFLGVILITERIEAMSEGDTCRVKNLEGRCKVISECENRLNKYFENNILTSNDIPNCGTTAFEEILCCPIEDCCNNVGTSTPRATPMVLRNKSPPKQFDLRTPETRVAERPAEAACRKIERREGIKNVLIKHIIGGEIVPSGFYPHMVAIGIQRIGIEFGCGGTLIEKRFVLTAAHCVSSTDEKPEFVRLGTADIQNKDSTYQDVRVKNVMIHPSYLSLQKYHDVAILELAEDAQYSTYIYPACLDTNIIDLPPNTSAYVSGWGIVNQTTRARSNLLKRAEVQIVSRQSCNESFAIQPAALGYLPNGVNDNLICAMDIKQFEADSCQGDSGGPLIYEESASSGNSKIIGIIASGIGCNTNTPSLYTRVAKYLDFIESKVWPIEPPKLI